MTGGIEDALAAAIAAAGERSVAIAGGAATINQFLAAGLIGELRLHVAPILLGEGERIFDGVTTPETTLTLSRRGSPSR
ncbi:dihydrofolate reductase family protein [Tessaracoccus coleopterorum]|uniref:dihydrofolate reductase family protein n=1 Tax=Tessaracoccus coleopterorum TaxID=2714950 RepID=UPI002F90FEBD